MDHTVENKHFPGVFEATPLRAPVRPWGHAPRQANPVLTQGRRGAQGRDTPPFKELQSRIRSEVSESQAKIIDLASEKGASSWLTSLPLAKYGFVLNKQMFHDAICLRYNFALKLVARTCVCGEDYTINHCLTCKKGGYVILRHNSPRDLIRIRIRIRIYNNASLGISVQNFH